MAGPASPSSRRPARPDHPGTRGFVGFSTGEPDLRAGAALSDASELSCWRVTITLGISPIVVASSRDAAEARASHLATELYGQPGLVVSVVRLHSADIHTGRTAQVWGPARRP